MKVFICYEFDEQHGGGGTSVLENLRGFFISQGVYVNDPAEAQIILFNSFHAINEVIKLKYLYPEKLFIHRIDGPMGVYNSPADLRDEYVFLLNKYLADATIFQTEWSKRACEILGLNTEKQQTQTIINAPDSSIFKYTTRYYNPQDRLKIFYSSWSTNINKGFDALHWLDENLDWSKYEFEFAGRTEKSFKNIKMLGKLTKEQIAEKLKESHIFLFASKFDPCSNSLAEAIATGIPIVSYDGGGSPELLPHNSFKYKEYHELLEILEEVRIGYSSLAINSKPKMNFDKMTAAYLSFIQDCLSSNIKAKHLNRYRKVVLKFKVLMIRVLSRFNFISSIFGQLSGKYSLKLTIQKQNRLILDE